MSARRKYLIAALVALLWGGAMLAAFWWFEARYLRTFDGERAELFSGDALRLPAELQGPGPVRFVHFWDPGCPCNVGNQQHLEELLKHFAGQPVVFYEVRRPGSKGRLPQPLASLKSLGSLPGSDLLPASPAVGIWDQHGELVYIGPYSEARYAARTTASSSRSSRRCWPGARYAPPTRWRWPASASGSGKAASGKLDSDQMIIIIN